MNAPAHLIERARQAEAAGQYEIAAAAYDRLRLPADAARASFRGGRFADAARHFREAQLFYEAAVCQCKVDRAVDALDDLLRVPRDHATYRKAAQLAVRIASDHRAFGMQVDHFLARYLATPPLDEFDLDAFDRVARFYESEGFNDQALDLLRKMATVHPTFRDTAQRLERLAQAARSAPVIRAEHAREAVAFQAVGAQRKSVVRDPGKPLPELPGLPALPSLPPTPPRATQNGIPAMRGVTVTRGPAAASARSVANDATHAMQLELNALDLPAGALLAGRYAIESKIGEGGMAAVYRAHDRELDEPVALKTFQSDDPALLTRFKQEVALSRQLGHPNVIRLYDIGVQGRMRFLTMELLEGRSLEACLGAPVDLRTGVGLLLQACAGLGAAHARGIVHRDIKPANFFLTRDGAVKLMDFGIAKRQSAAQSLTTAGFIAGTPHYMAPEQINNFAKATAQSDLYAIGVMAFEMFAGAVPFDHEDLMSLLMMHLRDAPPRLRERNPRVPASLDALVASLLAKEADARPQGCDELMQRLRAVLRELGG